MQVTQEIQNKLHSGDQDAWNELYEAHIGLLITVAKKFKNTGLSWDDRISAVHEALVRSANNYNPGKGVKFSSYLGTAAKNSIINVAKIKSHIPKTVSMDKVVVDEEGREVPFGNLFYYEVDFDAALIINEIMEIAEQIIKKHKPHQQDLIRRNLKGEPAYLAALNTGMCKSWGTKLVQAFKQELRTALIKQGYMEQAGMIQCCANCDWKSKEPEGILCVDCFEWKSADDTCEKWREERNE